MDYRGGGRAQPHKGIIRDWTEFVVYLRSRFRNLFAKGRLVISYHIQTENTSSWGQRRLEFVCHKE